jgi:hypothetical protein
LLEAGVCCTYFPFENWVSFSKEYCLALSIFLWEKYLFCA